MSVSNVELNIFLIRHAQCDANTKQYLVVGRRPTSDLTALGFRQSRALGLRLVEEGVNFDAIYSSTLDRCLKTALTALAAMRAKHTPVKLRPELMEQSVGIWEGMPREKVFCPQTLEEMALLGPDFAPPDGESQRMVAERVVRWLKEEVLHSVKSRDGKRVIGVVTHNIVTKALLAELVGFDQKLLDQTVIGNTAITELCLSGGSWLVKRFNDTDHLDKLGGKGK